MSLKYFGRYQFNNPSDPAEEDFGLRDLALEAGASIDTETDGTYGTVLDMDGTISLLSTGEFVNISGSLDRSFSFWVKNETSGSDNPVLSYGDLVGGSAFVVYSDNSSSHPQFSDYTTISEVTSHTSVVSTWSFYAIVYSSGSLMFYIDSVLVDTFSTTLSTGTADALRIGTDGLGNYFTGNVSDFRMYTTVLDSITISYMFSVGPNFEEKLVPDYVEDSNTQGLSVTGSLISRSTYAVQETGEVLQNSYYIYDENSDLQEASRIEHSEDVNGHASISMKTRHTEAVSGDTVLFSSIDATPENTTFTSTDDTDTLSCVIFSSDGVSVTSEKPGGIYFGAGKDFRIAVDGDSMVIEAYSSIAGDYVTKMEIGK